MQKFRIIIVLIYLLIFSSVHVMCVDNINTQIDKQTKAIFQYEPWASFFSDLLKDQYQKGLEVYKFQESQYAKCFMSSAQAVLLQYYCIISNGDIKTQLPETECNAIMSEIHKNLQIKEYQELYDENEIAKQKQFIDDYNRECLQYIYRKLETCNNIALRRFVDAENQFMLPVVPKSLGLAAFINAEKYNYDELVKDFQLSDFATSLTLSEVNIYSAYYAIDSKQYIGNLFYSYERMRDKADMENRLRKAYKIIDGMIDGNTFIIDRIDTPQILRVIFLTNIITPTVTHDYSIVFKSDKLCVNYTNECCVENIVKYNIPFYKDANAGDTDIMNYIDDEINKNMPFEAARLIMKKAFEVSYATGLDAYKNDNINFNKRFLMSTKYFLNDFFSGFKQKMHIKPNMNPTQKDLDQLKQLLESQTNCKQATLLSDKEFGHQQFQYDKYNVTCYSYLLSKLMEANYIYISNYQQNDIYALTNRLQNCQSVIIKSLIQLEASNHDNNLILPLNSISLNTIYDKQYLLVNALLYDRLKADAFTSEVYAELFIDCSIYRLYFESNIGNIFINNNNVTVTEQLLEHKTEIAKNLIDEAFVKNSSEIIFNLQNSGIYQLLSNIFLNNYQKDEIGDLVFMNYPNGIIIKNTFINQEVINDNLLR